MATRIRIAPGIWRKGDLLFAMVRAGNSRDGSQRDTIKSFSLDTPIIKIQSWRLGAKKDLLDAGPLVPGRGTLGADLLEYIERLPEGRYKKDSRSILQHWIDSPLGSKPRTAITRQDVIDQLSRWTDKKAAINTRNKRLSRLRRFYLTVDEPDTPNPTDGLKFTREPDSDNRDIPARIVHLILDSLPDVGRADAGGKRPTFSQSKLRLRCMAWTGLTPASLVKLRPRDVLRTRAYLPAREKGKGSGARWVDLIPPAAEALQEFVRAGLCGKTWSRSSLRKTWHVGIARARARAAAIATDTGDHSWLEEIAALPEGCRPYDLRHAFASEIYRITGDLRAVAELLQHTELDTTKRYTKGAVSERVAVAVAKAATVYATMPTLPSPAKPLRLVGKS